MLATRMRISAGAFPEFALVDNDVNATTQTTPYTFASSPIGDAAADRLIVIGAGIHGTDLTNAGPFDDITADSNSFTDITTLFQTDGGGSDEAAIAVRQRSIPTGTTSSIVVDPSLVSGNCFNASIAMWRLTGLNSTTPLSSGSTGTESTSTLSIASITIPAGGVLIAYARWKNNSGYYHTGASRQAISETTITLGVTLGASGATWSEATEDFDSLITGTGLTTTVYMMGYAVFR